MKIDKRKVRIALAEQGLNQRALAIKMGISEAYVSNTISRNNPKIETVENMANALGKKVEDIVEERK